MSEQPQRTAAHDQLEVFLGEWTAEGRSYGGAQQETWMSTVSARWHTGRYFLIQDERAIVGGKRFDTHAIFGVEAETQQLFARTFENHGFARQYEVANEGRIWTFTGEHERARIDFSADGRTQKIAWEWRPEDTWVLLCDRVATRTD